MLPGNTADMTVLLPIADRLRSRFGIGRVCVVEDRGMISTATIAALEERGLDCILGARDRRTKAVHEVVRKDKRPFLPLLIERPRGEKALIGNRAYRHYVRQTGTGKRVTNRTHVQGQVGNVFRAAGVALPPNARTRRMTLNPPKM